MKTSPLPMLISLAPGGTRAPFSFGVVDEFVDGAEEVGELETDSAARATAPLPRA
jgi:hypothetical protein